MVYVPSTVPLSSRALPEWYVSSCMRNERAKSVSPKIRRAGEHHQTCAKLSQTKLHHASALYEVFVSAYVMLGVSYSRFVFNRRALEKSRSRKTQ